MDCAFVRCAQTIDRIGQFEEALHGGGADAGAADATPRIARPALLADVSDGNGDGEAGGPLLRVDALTLAPPRAAASAPPLIRDLSFSVFPGEHLLIMVWHIKQLI